MAAAASAKRDSSKERLAASIRQLRRYIDAAPTKNARILQQKMDRVKEDRDLLVSDHHVYGQKAETLLNSPEMRTYIETPTDEAIDILDEAELLIEGFEEERDTNMNTLNSTAKKAQDIATGKIEISSNINVVREAINKLLQVVVKESPTDADSSYVKSIMSDIELRERELTSSWHNIHPLLTAGEIQAYTTEETTVRKEIYDARSKGQEFITSIQSTNESLAIARTSTPLNNSGASRRFSNMEKMKAPKFSGRIRDFARFKSDFQEIVVGNCRDVVQQRYVLKEQCLENEAKDLVRNLDDLDEIWERLSETYGDSIQIVDAVIKDLQKATISNQKPDKHLVEFVGVLEKGVQDLKMIGKDSLIATEYTVLMITQKLPRRVQLEWLKEDPTAEGYERFMNLLKFLKGERKRIERALSLRPEREPPPIPSPGGRGGGRVNHVGGARRDGPPQEPPNTCLIHPEARHLTRKCDAFKRKSVQQRGQLVKDMDACELCLTIKHVGNACPYAERWEPCGVDACDKYHSRLLHGCTVPGLRNFHIHQPTQSTEEKTLLLFQTIRYSNGSQVNVFWDNGSQLSLVSKSYANHHKLSGIPVDYDLLTVNNTVQPQQTMFYEVPLYDRQGKRYIIKAYEIDSICEDTDFVDMKQIVKLFNKVSEREVRRPNGAMDLLIGSDNLNLHPDKIEMKDGLALFKSMFGTGKIIGGKHGSIVSNRKLTAFAKIVASATVRNVRAARPPVDFFTAEGFGSNCPPKCKRCCKMQESCNECKFLSQELSIAEQRELKVIEENLQLNPVTSKWETSYPYSEDPAVLNKHGDNREQAMALLVKTENRLARDPVASSKYREQFKDYIDRGVFRELTDEELREYDGPVRYVSHHEVYKEDSESTALRIVINTSLKYKGVSVNDKMFKGPNALNSLFVVQLRFREYAVAVICDVKKMYQSINTKITERHLRRVLWRDLDTSVEPKTYGTETMMFGDKAAAAISAVALKETAELFEHVNPRAASVIKDVTYVDDIPAGVMTTEKSDVEELKQGITAILAKGGMEVKGFVTSGSDENRHLLGTGEVGKVLGSGYDAVSDEFVTTIRVNISKKKKGLRSEPDMNLEQIKDLPNRMFSRRMVVGCANLNYDPYGFLTPLTVQMKIQARELYRPELHLEWDDDIPYEKKVVWSEVLTRLKQAENIRFRRSIYNVNAVGDPELIIFCDGSPSAMCAVIYIRWELDNGEFDVCLVSSKSRVTPLERMTTPRAEIQAATIGVRLCNKIIGSIRFNFKQRTFLSDSTATLATLNKEETTALNEFFGNRQAECLASSDKSEWFKVPTDENIADLGTKMLAQPEDIDENSDWQTGGWLRKKRELWPITQNFSSADVPKEALVAAKGMCNLIRKEVTHLFLSDERLLAHSYSFVMRSTARLYFIYEKRTLRASLLTPECLLKAEAYWLKESMRHTSVELEKGHLNPLRPHKDEDGVICLSSRAVKGFRLNYNVDRFPILTAKDPLAYLWMRHVHEEDHSGVAKTLSKSRRKYWIIRGGRLSQKIRGSCYTCRTLDKKLAGQLMAPLPEYRLAESPVFYVTALDLFGPMLIKDMVKKRTTMKVWGTIFTCAASRAVWLDVTPSYSTDSILQTIEKFMRVRGMPSEIISDQGSQLKAASKELTKDWNWSKVSDSLSARSIKWTIVPAEGQHQNGLAESMIKCTKRSIHHMIGENVLSFSELQLAFFEIADIINSRPIGVLPNSDPECPTPLTPNGLIIGQNSNEVPCGPFRPESSPRSRYNFVKELVDDWWKRWYNQVLPSLVPSYKWTQSKRNVQVGDICMIRYKGMRSTYRLGRVTQVHTGVDGLVRRATLEYRLPTEKTFRSVERSVHGVCVIVPVEEQ